MPTLRLSQTEVVLTYATDIHLAAIAPGRRRGSYRQDILAKLYWWSELTHKVGGVALCGGDAFHIKLPTSPSNSFGVINDAIHAFGSFPLGRVLGSVGNHDVTGDNLGTLQDQPMGVLMSAGVYQPVGCSDEDPMILESTDGTRVRVDTFDWMPGPDLLRALQAQVTDPDTRRWHFRVAVVHSFQQPGTSGALFKDYALGHADLKGTDYDVICYGHDHSRKGIVGYPTGPTHIQLGSLSRATLAADEVDRDVSVAVIKLHQGEPPTCTEHLVPVRPLDMAFHTSDLVVAKVDTREDVKTFFQGLEQQAKDIQQTDPIKVLGELTDDPAITQTICEVCELTPTTEVPDGIK